MMNLKLYLVGGAVRDQLLGRAVHERDWVVVGATPQQLLDLGFYPVGKDFPVFLHPQTHEEYALARTERKNGLGYKGFQFYADPNVKLEEDLARRDLTINAIAQTEDGQLIDPFGGQKDLKNHILRHVSPAFVEDPVRILRIARFAARFGEFTIHPTTQALMKEIVKKGEIDALVAERVWQEWVKALQETNPERFFETLIDCGAFEILFPEFKGQDKTFIHLKNAVKFSTENTVRFSVLFKGMPIKQMTALCKRYRVPREYTELAMLLVKHYADYEKTNQLDAAPLLNLLEKLDVFRRPNRLDLFLSACEIIENSKNSEKSRRIQKACSLAKSVNVQKFIQNGLVGAQISESLHQERIKILNTQL